MAKQYASFMLRWWHSGPRSQLIEIEHIQTGERLLFGALADAFDWIAAHDGAAAHGAAPVASALLATPDVSGEAAAAK